MNIEQIEEDMLLVILTSNAKVAHRFEGMIHHIETVRDFNLDPEKFYVKLAKEVPVLPHIEIEIILPKVWEHQHENEIHYQPTPNRETHFVCIPARIESARQALIMFRIWSTGTLYTMETGKDFTDLLKALSGNTDQFFEHLKDKHGISIVV
ncbi:hypothetical protein COB55_00710 [Candidatus Wolfebacteria bacterium]|nr:MAG: hypothetical protein COB55_00710 [Candidatus Wolfebacteria bacterium]